MEQEQNKHCPMSRRCFLNWMGMGTLAAVIAPGVIAQAGEEKQSGDTDMEKEKSQEVASRTVEINPEELVAYCGGYCGTCGICGYNIQTSLAAVQNVMQVAGFRREAEHLGWPLMRDIATHCCGQFEEQLDSFAQLADKLFPSNCRGGCVAPCEIAKCCKGKGFFTCAECSEMESCEQIAESGKLNSLMDIRKMGVKPWAKKQFEDATETRRKAMLDAVNKAFG